MPKIPSGQVLVVLIGAPGSGKTSVGTRLARKLGVPFTDGDVEFERRHELSPADYLITHGEAAFRALEREVSVDLLQGDGVLALASGAPASLNGELAPATVVFLDVDARQAGRRLGLNASQPGLFAQARSTLVKQLAERRPVYAQLAQHIVDTSGQSLDDVVDDVAQRLS